MKHPAGPVETKVAGGGAIGAAITLALLLNSWQHWFQAPPADVTAGVTAALATLTGYLLPHTHLPPAHTVFLKGTIGETPAGPGSPEPAVQPPATGTGGTSG